MGKATLTFEVDETLRAAFAEAARAMDLSEADLLRDLMRDYLRGQDADPEGEAWFRAEVQKGIDAADAGDLIANEAVEAEAVAWRADMLAKLADPNP